MSGHLALLVAEAVLCGGIVLLLFRLRRHIGMAPLYMVLGALQYLQFVLAASLRVELLPGVTAGPAATVLFPLTIFVVLLTYVDGDAEATRHFAYGVVVCNITVYSVAALAGQHVDLPGLSNPLQLPKGLFQQPWRTMFASSVAVLLDMLATVVLFEWVSRRVSTLFLRLWLTAAAVMVLDAVAFSTLGFAGQPVYLRLMAGSLVGKLVGATVFAAVVTGYVRLFERQGGHHGHHDPPGDVFRWLTYRQRYEEARSLMARDALTGLYNRGYFDEFAPRQLAHADRARHPMSLVVIDIDDLKATNDRHGHRAGDELVRFVAAELRHMVRASDAACRYGGDEFVVVLTTADAPAARIFAERLCQNIRTKSAATVPPPPWAPATVTVGVATTPADGTTVEALLHCADERLYEGKRQGRDRVVGVPAVS